VQTSACRQAGIHPQELPSHNSDRCGAGRAPVGHLTPSRLPTADGLRTDVQVHVTVHCSDMLKNSSATSFAIALPFTPSTCWSAAVSMNQRVTAGNTAGTGSRQGHLRLCRPLSSCTASRCCRLYITRSHSWQPQRCNMRCSLNLRKRMKQPASKAVPPECSDTVICTPLPPNRGQNPQAAASRAATAL
jgi:hypothetical protein